MSLTGNLEVFPLEEVLRLLARSRKTGCLRVESGKVHGRTYINSGAITLSTVGSDDEMRRALLAAGLVGEEELRRVELNGETLAQALAEGVSPGALTDFVREMTVESLFRIRRGGSGNFDFVVDLAPRYPTGQSFDPDAAVSEADRREAEWTEIEGVVPDLHTPLKMAPSLPDDNNVTINPATWRVLAVLEDGASVTQLADLLGLSHFRAAREMAGLVRNQLVVVSGDAAIAAEAPPAAQEPELPPAPQEETKASIAEPPAQSVEGFEGFGGAAATPSPSAPLAPAPPAEPAPAPPAPAAPLAPAEASQPAPPEDTGFWSDPSPKWSEPEAPAPAAAADQLLDPLPPSAEQPAEPVAEPAAPHTDGWFTDDGAESGGEDDRTAGWWTTSDSEETDQSSTGDPEADRFLESVFSQLTDEVTEIESKQPEEETGFSMGLLRRRRMGAAAKEDSDGEG